jgi:hypothetical protein
MRKRTEVHTLNLTANQALALCVKLNANPPKGWIKGSFKQRSQRETFTQRRTYQVIGDRELFAQPAGIPPQP